VATNDGNCDAGTEIIAELAIVPTTLNGMLSGTFVHDTMTSDEPIAITYESLSDETHEFGTTTGDFQLVGTTTVAGT
jgi:hypothetical protein